MGERERRKKNKDRKRKWDSPFWKGGVPLKTRGKRKKDILQINFSKKTDGTRNVLLGRRSGTLNDRMLGERREATGTVCGAWNALGVPRTEKVFRVLQGRRKSAIGQKKKNRAVVKKAMGQCIS